MISENCLELNKQGGVRAIGAELFDEKHAQTHGPALGMPNPGAIAPVCKQKHVTSTAMDSKILTQMPGGVARQRPTGKYRVKDVGPDGFRH